MRRTSGGLEKAAPSPPPPLATPLWALTSRACGRCRQGARLSADNGHLGLVARRPVAGVRCAAGPPAPEPLRHAVRLGLFRLLAALARAHGAAADEAARGREQVLGFAVLIFGTLLYNEIVRLPCLSPVRAPAPANDPARPRAGARAAPHCSQPTAALGAALPPPPPTVSPTTHPTVPAAQAAGEELRDPLMLGTGAGGAEGGAEEGGGRWDTEGDLSGDEQDTAGAGACGAQGGAA